MTRVEIERDCANCVRQRTQDRGKRRIGIDSNICPPQPPRCLWTCKGLQWVKSPDTRAACSRIDQRFASECAATVNNALPGTPSTICGNLATHRCHCSIRHGEKHQISCVGDSKRGLHDCCADLVRQFSCALNSATVERNDTISSAMERRRQRPASPPNADEADCHQSVQRSNVQR
jgi:hypothetical protein